MKIENIDIEAAVEKARDLIREDKQLSDTSKSVFELLILIITLLANRLNLNSRNSSKPPSSDINRKKEPKREVGRKPGGQNGHIGTTLKKIDNPDKVEEIPLDQSLLPPGVYKKVGFEARQVFDIDISRVVTEYRAEVAEDADGNRYVASFPEGITRPVQYGNGVKAQSVYMSQFQMIPYNRVQDYFSDQLFIPISEGSIYNFNQEAFSVLEGFEQWVKARLAASDLLHSDETGINIGGDRHWLHSVSNPLYTLYYPHEKRGMDAMTAMGILPVFNGILVHDHWKPYYQFRCTHALCNAHHIRELTRAFEQDGHKWAEKMKNLLETINSRVKDAGGVIDINESHRYRMEYRGLIREAEIECPEPGIPNKKGKRGRIKRSKSRNLLERLRDYEEDVLRFMDHEAVPFTNNQGENDIRMTKVQQKISGCFRSMEGSMIFCRVRSYLSTCRKHGIQPSRALSLLFKGQFPDFIV